MHSVHVLLFSLVIYVSTVIYFVVLHTTITYSRAKGENKRSEETGVDIVSARLKNSSSDSHKPIFTLPYNTYTENEKKNRNYPSVTPTEFVIMKETTFTPRTTASPRHTLTLAENVLTSVNTVNKKGMLTTLLTNLVDVGTTLEPRRLQNKAISPKGEFLIRTSIHRAEIWTKISKPRSIRKEVTSTSKNNSILARVLVTTEAPRMRCKNASVQSHLEHIKRSTINIDEITSYTKTHCFGAAYPQCNQTSVGPLFVNRKPIELSTLYQSELQFVKRGGWWSPYLCAGYPSTAIVIPFRNRYHHLPTLLRQLHPILKRQQLHYRIFVIDQADESSFNRGKLMNVGYSEALKLFPYSCFVFHDVDLVPEDDRISYGCKYSPMHLSAAVDKFRYTLPYASIFGGVEMFSSQDYQRVNGFSNIFWSWGGEDDNLRKRVDSKRMHVRRQSIQVSRYTMLAHKSKDVNRGDDEVKKTALLMNTAYVHRHEDGLNSLQYKVVDIIEHNLFTLVRVDLQKSEDKSFGIMI